MALTILTQLNHPLATALSGHLTYPDMPFKSICPDSRQTFLAWEPHFCLDCQEALTGIIQGPAGRRKYQHSHIDASISGNHIKAFVLAQHDVDIIFAGDGTSIWQLLCPNIRGLGYRRFSLQATWAFWILVTRRIAHLTPEVVPAPLHTLAATGLKMMCHKVHGKEYECRHRPEVQKNCQSQAKNWWGIKGRFQYGILTIIYILYIVLSILAY